MEIKILPEVKLARKIIHKHSLEIPFDIDSLVKEYADLIYKPIPVSGIDGVSLNLKTPGKKPLIIVNSSLQKQRQFFTLAHELGHFFMHKNKSEYFIDGGIYRDEDCKDSSIEIEANGTAKQRLICS